MSVVCPLGLWTTGEGPAGLQLRGISRSTPADSASDRVPCMMHHNYGVADICEVGFRFSWVCTFSIRLLGPPPGLACMGHGDSVWATAEEPSIHATPEERWTGRAG